MFMSSRPYTGICGFVGVLVAVLCSCDSGNVKAPTFRESMVAEDLNLMLFSLAKKWSEEFEGEGALYAPISLIDSEAGNGAIEAVYYSSSSLVVLHDGSIGIDLDVDEMIVALIADPGDAEGGFRFWSVWPKVELIGSKGNHE